METVNFVGPPWKSPVPHECAGTVRKQENRVGEGGDKTKESCKWRWEAWCRGKGKIFYGTAGQTHPHLWLRGPRSPASLWRLTDGYLSISREGRRALLMPMAERPWKSCLSPDIDRWPSVNLWGGVRFTGPLSQSEALEGRLPAELSHENGAWCCAGTAKSRGSLH